jgi:hypothetical protein
MRNASRWNEIFAGYEYLQLKPPLKYSCYASPHLADLPPRPPQQIGIIPARRDLPQHDRSTCARQRRAWG